jgi:2-methylcitrate dehydratase PrpD
MTTTTSAPRATDSAPADDLTGDIVRTALGTDLDRAATDSVRAVQEAALDCLACAVVGSQDEGSHPVAQWAVETGGPGDATIIGTAQQTTAPLAALANATAAHAFDFDDVSLRMIHPSVTLIPGLVALGQQLHLSGRTVIESYLAGFEVEARLCKVMNPEHYGRGWHTTGTIGVLGAAMAAARALGLDEAQARSALGIAASSASGLRKNFGSMVKPLHAGQSAFHGLQAARMAQLGFEANPDIMEGPSSYLSVFSVPEAVEAAYEAFAPGAPAEIVTSGIGLKRFACCGAIHPAQDAVLEILAGEPFDSNDVVRMECRVNEMAPKILVHHVTQHGLEGKFSLEYSLAVCLLDGEAGLAQYADTRARDPKLYELMKKVDVVVDPTIPVNLAFFPSVVTVELSDGRVLRARVDIPKGYPDNPLSETEVTDKARGCCRGILTSEQTDALVTTLMHLAECEDVAVLGPMLTVGDAGKGR